VPTCATRLEKAEVHAALADLANRGFQVPHGVALEKIPGDPRPERREDVVALAEHRQEDRARRGTDPENLAAGVDPVQQRHHEVEDRDVGAMFLRQLHRLAPIAGLGDDGEPVPLQHGPEALAHHEVIVGDQDSDRHAAARSTGPPPPQRATRPPVSASTSSR